METNKVDDLIYSDDIFYGSIIKGIGTIYSVESCKIKGFININCSQIALTSEEGVIIILTKNLSLKEKYNFKIGSNINFSDCILTEIQNSRGVAGYEFKNYFKNLGTSVRESIIEGLEIARSSNDFDLGYTDAIYGISSKLIENLSLPKYVNSITCETNLKNLQLISN